MKTVNKIGWTAEEEKISFSMYMFAMYEAASL